LGRCATGGDTCRLLAAANENVTVITRLNVLEATVRLVPE